MICGNLISLKPHARWQRSQYWDREVALVADLRSNEAYCAEELQMMHLIKFVFGYTNNIPRETILLILLFLKEISKNLDDFWDRKRKNSLYNIKTLWFLSHFLLTANTNYTGNFAQKKIEGILLICFGIMDLLTLRPEWGNHVRLLGFSLPTEVNTSFFLFISSP